MGIEGLWTPGEPPPRSCSVKSRSDFHNCLILLALPLAGVEGLEPPTPGFGDRCSSQLSYTPSAERPLSTPASSLGSAALRCRQARRRGAEASRDTDPHPQI